VYVANIAQFASYFCKSPERLGPAEIRAYLIFLANDKRLTVSSISVAVAALRFLYTVTLKRRWAIEDNIPAGRRGNKLPAVLSQEKWPAFWQPSKT
jgi:integrase/recombinase XerD